MSEETSLSVTNHRNATDQIPRKCSIEATFPEETSLSIATCVSNVPHYARIFKVWENFTIGKHKVCFKCSVSNVRRWPNFQILPKILYGGHFSRRWGNLAAVHVSDWLSLKYIRVYDLELMRLRSLPNTGKTLKTSLSRSTDTFVTIPSRIFSVDAVPQK